MPLNYEREETIALKDFSKMKTTGNAKKALPFEQPNKSFNMLLLNYDDSIQSKPHQTIFSIFAQLIFVLEAVLF